MSEEILRLTQYAHGAGCGCKIAPQVLDEILKTNTDTGQFKSLLISHGTKDDAAVYQLNDSEALIATTDFFTPIVDDPYLFGQVAAANAISDVYAMGGTPLLALAIFGWPVEKLPIAAAQQVLEGARSICADANIPLAGGHSIDTTEPVFGLSVNGRANTKHLRQNNTALEGNHILLTKPIGVGILSTAGKRGVLEELERALLHGQLVQLNQIGEMLGKIPSVQAMTDVTGFGLAGHLIEMAEGSGLSAELNYDAIPRIQGIETYLAKNTIPDATYRNWKSYGDKIQLGSNVNFMQAFQLLPDPQTNGGLMIAVAPEGLEEVQALLAEGGYAPFTEPIGRFIPKNEKVVYVH